MEWSDDTSEAFQRPVLGWAQFSIAQSLKGLEGLGVTNKDQNGGFMRDRPGGEAGTDYFNGSFLGCWSGGFGCYWRPPAQRWGSGQSTVNAINTGCLTLDNEEMPGLPGPPEGETGKTT